MRVRENGGENKSCQGNFFHGENLFSRTFASSVIGRILQVVQTRQRTWQDFSKDNKEKPLNGTFSTSPIEISASLTLFHRRILEFPFLRDEIKEKSIKYSSETDLRDWKRNFYRRIIPPEPDIKTVSSRQFRRAVSQTLGADVRCWNDFHQGSAWFKVWVSEINSPFFPPRRMSEL